MTKFSANLGFLWSELALPDAIRAAKDAGFDAVECHFPYETPAAEVNDALAETGLKMLGINTIAGNSYGLAAMCGLESEAKAAIDQAVAYGSQIGAKHIHVMAGVANGEKAHQCFVTNLQYATASASEVGISILIEPLNPRDAPGYFLSSTAQAAAIIAELGAPNLKMMFDCYHVQLIEGNLTSRLKEFMPIIGHIQFASVPDRGPPNSGEINYSHIFQYINDIGWNSPLGAEYRPNGDTAASLDWLLELSAR
ncbi:MAG: TIM barrel protein [Pseudomonadota bacterium]